jgi:hypothetical protein
MSFVHNRQTLMAAIGKQLRALEVWQTEEAQNNDET